MYEGRACYLDTWPGQESYILDKPIFEDEAPSQSPIGFESQEMTLEDVFEALEEIEEIFPDIPPFEALRLYYSQPKEVCPTSMIETYMMYLMEAEQAAREYHLMPYSGGLWDQPQALLQVFSAIRVERNQYERIRFDKIKAKTKKGQGKQDAGTIPQTTSSLPPRNR